MGRLYRDSNFFGLYRGMMNGSCITIRAVPGNNEKKRRGQRSQSNAKDADGHQPACVLRLALPSLHSLPFSHYFWELL